MDKGYEIAIKNTKYNKDGKAVISKDDEWLEETEWDEVYEELRGSMTETEYLTANPANRERLLRSIRELEESKRRTKGGIMERLDAIVKEHIPEATIWRFKKSRKAIIDNPSNSILNGTYESYIIFYQDKYEAEFIDCILFKNEEFFGIESSLRGRIDSTFLLWAPRNDISIYDYIEKKGYDEFKRDLVVFELLDREELNKVISIRDYVGISQERYDGVPFVGVEGIDHRAMLSEIYENTKQIKDALIKQRESLSVADKIFFRSIALLAKSMVDEESPDERKNTADKICELLEDYIADFNEETLAAKREVEDMKANPSGDYKTYTDAGEMIADILSEDDE